MRSHRRPGGTQLQLVTADPGRDGLPRPAPTPAPARARGRRGGRNLRMADRLDEVAAAAEREAMELVLAGSTAAAREALDRATAARKAARILRAGPEGVRRLLAS